MSQVDVDSGIENMEVDENDRREKRSLSDKVSEAASSRVSVCGEGFPFEECLISAPAPESSYSIVQAGSELEAHPCQLQVVELKMHAMFRL